MINLFSRQVHWQGSVLLLPIIYFIHRSYRMYLDRLGDEKRHVEEMAGLHLRTIEALALAIEAKDHTTHEHLRRVRVYAVEIGKEMGLSAPDLEALRAAALLHDIGKLAIPEHIISKPGRLTPEEFEKMKIHPVVGAEILERVSFPYPVVPLVRAHHEKWDGSGYPDGLKGEEIPLGARILAAVDCLDATGGGPPIPPRPAHGRGHAAGRRLVRQGSRSRPWWKCSPAATGNWNKWPRRSLRGKPGYPPNSRSRMEWSRAPASKCRMPTSATRKAISWRPSPLPARKCNSSSN